MPEQLIARWDDWSPGVGFLYGSSGLAYGTSWIGGIGYLSPMALPIQRSTVIDSGYIIRHGFVNKDSNDKPHLYLIADDGTNSKIYKFNLTTASYGTAEGNVAYSGKRLGHPIRYKGNWYYTELGGSVMRKLTTTGTADISGDTITDGNAGSGDGHLINYGHQIAKIQETTGISILKTDGDANVDADWGSDFPVGDSSDPAVGGASVKGRAYVQRGKGLYTFNDRGRAGSVFEDFEAWQLSDVKYWSMVAWKGGLVFSRLDSIYYWNPTVSSFPIDISIGARNLPDDKVNLVNISSIVYRTVTALGNYLFVAYDITTSTGNVFGVMAGEAKDDPTSVSWWPILENSVVPSATGIVPITDGEKPGATTGTTTVLMYQVTATSITFLPLSVSGSPLVSTEEAMSGTRRMFLPYIQLQGLNPTKIKIHVEGIISSATTPSSVRPHFEIYGDRFISSSITHPLIGEIFQNGISEFNIRNSASLNDRLSLNLMYITEFNPSQVTPPVIRWIEVYGEG